MSCLHRRNKFAKWRNVPYGITFKEEYRHPRIVLICDSSPISFNFTDNTGWKLLHQYNIAEDSQFFVRSTRSTLASLAESPKLASMFVWMNLGNTEIISPKPELLLLVATDVIANYS